MSGLGGILLTSTPSELGRHPDGKDPKVCYQSPILVKFSKGQGNEEEEEEEEHLLAVLDATLDAGVCE